MEITSDLGDNFWTFTSLRFFVLRDYILSHQCTKFYHAELDNVIFQLEELDNRLDSVGKGLFVPRDSEDRAIASLIYCNSIPSMLLLCELYGNHNIINDMHALGIFAQLYNNYFFSLPTESCKANSSLFDIVSPSICGGLFDAAAVGQYLFGIDPRHNRYRPTKSQFVNENSKVDWKKIKIRIDNNKRILLCDHSESDNSPHSENLYNLHLHSKRPDLLCNALNAKYPWNYISQNTQYVVANHYLYLLGPFLRIVDSLYLVFVRLFLRILKETKKSR